MASTSQFQPSQSVVPAPDVSCFRHPFGDSWLVRFLGTGDRVVLCLILLFAILNHLFTYLAYDWYAGDDAYSYDVAGLEIMTGVVLDPYPLMFRAPLVPVVKNILYLAFEGHQAALCAFMHLLGVYTVFLTWQLGRRFSRMAGMAAGTCLALATPISVEFHHVSSSALYIPLLLLFADRLVVWIRNPGWKQSLILGGLVFLCCMTRTEAFLLIPLVLLSGLFAGVGKRMLLVFFCSSMLMYNTACFGYFHHLGYWGITRNAGWALFERTVVPNDKLFSEDNGPASRQAGAYLRSELCVKLWQSGTVSPQDVCMVALSTAQEKLGYLTAEELFLRAGIETIVARPWDFFYDSMLRFLGQMDVYDPGLNNGGILFNDPMWWWREERFQEKHSAFLEAHHRYHDFHSPLDWERQYLMAKLLALAGKKEAAPPIPPEFQLADNVENTLQGDLHFTYSGNCALLPRKRIIHSFDQFFFWDYWGEGTWYPQIVKMLEAWYRVLPHGLVRFGLHTGMWLFWVAAIILTRDKKKRVILATLLSIVMTLDVVVAVFADAYGDRLFFNTVVFLWIGGATGGELLVQQLVMKIHQVKGGSVSCYLQ